MHSKLYFYLIAFPFEYLGLGLRKLSLSGAAGNILAIILYVLISLIPCFFFLRLKRSGKLLKTDFCLPALSIMLFVIIYYMINPGLFRTNVPGGGKMLLESTFYSVFFGYIILRVLEKCRQTDTRRLKSWLRGILAVIIFLCFYAILAECFENLSVSIQNLYGASSFPRDLTLTYVFLALQSMINALPYALAIFILFTAIRSLNELLSDRYSDASVAAVEKLSILCTRSLIIAVLSSMVFNILQLLFQKMLHHINIVISIPVFSVAFVLAVLLVTEYVRENQRLKRDNDLFI